VIFILLLGYIVLANRRNRRRLLRIASSDALTGLLSRKWTADLSNAVLEQARRQHHPVSVTLIDLDHFKSINDTYGHALGDEVLRQFAEAARKVVRTNDILGRWGGEEFLLVMPDTSATVACEVVERLRALTSDITLPCSDELTIRFSAGVTDQMTGRTLDELVARADLALYRAKAHGRNATCIYGVDDRAEPTAPDLERAPSARTVVRDLALTS
jgi:diguanylate cyclase (GGDEF)-like protein